MDMFFVFIALLICALKGLFYGAGSFMILERIAGNSRHSVPIHYVGWIIGLAVMIASMNAVFKEQRNLATADWCKPDFGVQYLIKDGTLTCITHVQIENRGKLK